MENEGKGVGWGLFVALATKRSTHLPSNLLFGLMSHRIDNAREALGTLT